MANEQLGEVPQNIASVPAPEVPGAGHTRIVIDAIQGSIKEIKDDVRDIKSHRHPDFILMIGIFSAGVVLLGTMFAAGYLRLDDKIQRLDDKIQLLSNTSIRVDTKLEDLLQRIPPVQAPAPKR